ncbi:uncharacterized protein IL334_007404 [Kwoniella shivajii]|uniref:Peroxin-14 n=1 Tax=Kwoniella shivajii TaxID=564305 RepID=A0ABZ1D8K5_9TREE|nr:hypothetical protein IL334_007404 [Kwoniella shivajii]
MPDDQSSGSSNADPTNNPLFGAPPPSSGTSPSPSPPEPQPQPAAPITPDSILSSSSSSTVPLTATTNPLFGASPPQDVYAHTGGNTNTSSNTNVTSQYQRNPREIHVYQPPRNGPHNFSYNNSSSSSSTSSFKTLMFIRRITYVLSMFLGISATLSALCSVFLLPLLHSSFSARKAIVDQQLTRVNSLVNGLKKLRGSKLYPNSNSDSLPTKSHSGSEESDYGEDSNNNNNRADQKSSLSSSRKEEISTKESQASLKEITSSSSSSSTSSQTDHHEHPEVPLPFQSISPILSLQTLSAGLKSLSSALDSTSTTRTSLISTLESYTSSIHRQLFVSRPAGGFGGYSVGMGSLSQHLGKNGESNGVDGLGGVKGEEWDSVRKEVRAIKGVLLNRRQFAQPQPQTQSQPQSHSHMQSSQIAD